MKKIGLYLDYDPADGGTFQYNQTMIDAVAALPADRYSVVFGYSSDIWLKYLAEYDKRKIFVPAGFWGRGISFVWTRLALPMALLRALTPNFHPIAKALFREECDLWIFTSPTAKSFQVPVPALVSIHDLMHRYERSFPESASVWEYFSRERNLKNICRWGKGFLVDSECGKSQLAELYACPMERIHPLPYIAPAYMHIETPPEGFDLRYRLPDKFLFYPAQFWKHKNHRNLLDALKLLMGDFPDLKLVLAGSPKNEYEAVVYHVRKLDLGGNVKFLGYVPDEDMPELYRRARALVMPTFFGPTNIPPLEAFVAGCPVVISSIYAIPEQVGDAALLFDPGSVKDLADCIARIWTDDKLCAELIAKGRKRAASWGRKQFNERLHSIIGEIVG